MPNENQNITLLELLINARCGIGDWRVHNKYEIVSAPLDIGSDDSLEARMELGAEGGLVTFSRENFEEIYDRLNRNLDVDVSHPRFPIFAQIRSDLRIGLGYEPSVDDSFAPSRLARLDYRLFSIIVRKTDYERWRPAMFFQGGVEIVSQKPILIELSVGQIDGVMSPYTFSEYGIVDKFRLDMVGGNHSVESLVFRPQGMTMSTQLRHVYDYSKRRLVPLAIGQELIYDIQEMDTNDFMNIQSILMPDSMYPPDGDFERYVHRSILSGYMTAWGHDTAMSYIGMVSFRDANRMMRIVHRRIYEANRVSAYDYKRVFLTETYLDTTNYGRKSLIPILRLEKFDEMINAIISSDSYIRSSDLLSTYDDLELAKFFYFYEIDPNRKSRLGLLIDRMIMEYRDMRENLRDYEDDHAAYFPAYFPQWLSSEEVNYYANTNMIDAVIEGGPQRAEGRIRRRGEGLGIPIPSLSSTSNALDDVIGLRRSHYDVMNDDEPGESDDYDDGSDFTYINSYHSSSMRTNVGSVRDFNYKALDGEVSDIYRDYIGLELEFAHDGSKYYQGSNYNYARSSFTELMTKDEDIFKHFDLSNDSSLNECGAEMVSLPMTYKYLLSKRDMFTTIFDTMREDDMLSLGGFHVHFGRKLIDDLLYDYSEFVYFPNRADRLNVIEALFDNLLYDAKTIDNGTNGGRGTFETLSTCILGREANPYCEKNTNFVPVWSNNNRSHRNWLSVNDVTFEFRTPSIPFSADDFYNKLHFLVGGIEIIRDYMINDYPKGVDRSVAVAKIRHHIVNCFETKMALLIKVIEKGSKDIPINSQIPFYSTYRKLVSFNKKFDYFTKENMLRDMTILLNMGDVFRSNTIDYVGNGNDNNGYIDSLFKSLGFLIDNGLMKIGVKMKENV